MSRAPCPLCFFALRFQRSQRPIVVVMASIPTSQLGRLFISIAISKERSSSDLARGTYFSLMQAAMQGRQRRFGLTIMDQKYIYSTSTFDQTRPDLSLLTFATQHKPVDLPNIDQNVVQNLPRPRHPRYGRLGCPRAFGSPQARRWKLERFVPSPR